MGKLVVKLDFWKDLRSQSSKEIPSKINDEGIRKTPKDPAGARETALTCILMSDTWLNLLTMVN